MLCYAIIYYNILYVCICSPSQGGGCVLCLNGRRSSVLSASDRQALRQGQRCLGFCSTPLRHKCGGFCQCFVGLMPAQERQSPQERHLMIFMMFILVIGKAKWVPSEMGLEQ